MCIYLLILKIKKGFKENKVRFWVYNATLENTKLQGVKESKSL